MMGEYASALSYIVLIQYLHITDLNSLDCDLLFWCRLHIYVVTTFVPAVHADDQTANSVSSSEGWYHPSDIIQ